MKTDNFLFRLKSPLIRFLPVEEKRSNKPHKKGIKNWSNFIFDNDNEWQQEYYVIYNSYILER